MAIVTRLSNGQYHAVSGIYNCVYTLELNHFDCSRKTDFGSEIISKNEIEASKLVSAIKQYVKKEYETLTEIFKNDPMKILG